MSCKEVTTSSNKDEKGMMISNDKPLPKLSASSKDLHRYLDVIEKEILPKTRDGVAAGNKVFGAAILLEDETKCTLIADTNHEMECPMYHGEVYVIQKWYSQQKPKQHNPSSCIFLSTHEPCCMCISSIVWTGFQKVFYLFPYETTAKQGIPHDIKIMHELWQVPSYKKQNSFLSTACLIDLIDEIPSSEEQSILKDRIHQISCQYDDLSKKYHSEKIQNDQNSLAFN